MTRALLDPLLRSAPVHAAPMAGGPSTPALVIASARAGHLAQLAAGYRSVGDLVAQIAEVRSAGVEMWGVNLFVPNPSVVSEADYTRYRDELAGEAARFGLGALPDLTEDDDEWEAKLAVLLADPVPLVSFTFGLPSAAVVHALGDVGTTTVQTVTSVAEARAAAAVGVDALVVQGCAAGGHSAVLDPFGMPEDRPLTELLAEVQAAVDLPLIAAGGVGSRDEVAALLAGGADAVAVGTALLRSTEAGTSAVHRAALADPSFDRTALTRAFTGRPARALVNRFAVEHGDAPAGYPALHHLTRPIRSAAAAAGDPSAVHLWAGAGWRSAAEEPAADILRRLTPLG